MPKHDHRDKRDLSKFDDMDTAVLEEMLRQDSLLPNEEASDTDAILYIMEVLAQRKKENSPEEIPDVDAAWDSFRQNYLPFTEDGSSLYEDGQPAKTVTFPADKRKSHGFFRSVCAAAAVLAVLFTVSLSAYAMGYDLWGAVAQWTKETFGFSTGTVPSTGPCPSTALDADIPEALRPLQAEFLKYGVPQSLLPTYLPEGYEQLETLTSQTSEYIDFFAMLSNNSNRIFINYRTYLSDNFTNEYQKDFTDPELYEVNGVQYYILNNNGNYLATWMSGNTECSISGIQSRQDLLDIISSINK